MLPIERGEIKTLSGDIHGSERISQRRVEASPVTADRKRIGERRYAGRRVSGQPINPEIVRQVGGGGSREARLIQGQVLHVDGIEIDAVPAAENHFAAELPGG